MKTVKQTMLVVLGLLFFSLQGCTHDEYIPVPGPPGENGTDGVSGTASCETCHSVAHKQPIIDAYNLSTHFLGGHVYGGITPSGSDQRNSVYADGSLNSNRAFCSQCHSQEGYIDTKKYGQPNPMGYDMVKQIGCEGCHGTVHRSLNFAVDGNDFGLRNIAAVPQKINPGFFLNASPTDGVSSANTCIGCHQARPDSNGYYKRPVIEAGEKDASGNVVITNSPTGPLYRYWSQRKLADKVGPYPAGTTFYKIYSNTGTSVHASEQGDLWMGINGIDIEGTTTRLPAAKTAAHYKSASCVKCHMDTPKPGTTNTGSHTFKLSFQTCVTCHSSPETLLTTFHAKFDAEIAKLVAAFAAKPTYFTVSGTGVSASVSIKAYDSTTGLPFPTTPGSGNTTPGVWYQSRTDFPLKYSQAYWNYKLVIGDEGKGVHNPLYVMALIQNSIEALK
ncbi:Cytochrome c554 and c-prime [Flavobacterium fluvii]|uniref:Cytochrome c554 and c-prime n=1 Tax=Flavobacterium fluvii TaxID=468056 RepID=A0A1M5N774_9FLAO|nr:multiheme c-type cytochrome [Flavobacterium fluvii]SHG85410.1 Cytochrome c554 and c-prime [Flavobacterium fluvii]